jgi:penicillin-binding protein 2
MPKDHDKQRIFTRRAIVLTGVQTLAFGVLASRLAYLQFFKSGEYGELAENNHIKLQPVPAERGLILDRFGLPIANNEKVFRLTIDPSGLTREAYKASLERLKKLLDLPDKKWEQLAAVKPSSATPPQPIKDSLSWEEVSRIELNTLSLARRVRQCQPAAQLSARRESGASDRLYGRGVGRRNETRPRRSAVTPAGF